MLLLRQHGPVSTAKQVGDGVADLRTPRADSDQGLCEYLGEHAGVVGRRTVVCETDDGRAGPKGM